MRFGFYIAIIITSLSCRRELPYKQDKNIPDLPVVHAFICPDSAIHVNCRTLAGLLTEDQPISQAAFTLSRNGIFQGVSNYSGLGIHQFSNQNFKPGDSFAFAGLIGSDKRISVQGKIPNRIELTMTDTSWQPMPATGMAFTVKLKFTDSAAYTNFYRVYFRKTTLFYQFDSADKVKDSIVQSELIPIYGTGLPVIQNNYNNFTLKEILFSDATFNGVSQSFLFYTTDKLKRTRMEVPVRLDVVVESLEKSLYTYYNTRNAHLWQQQSISQIPGVVQGNILGALGVVGAYTVQSVVIRFK